MNPRRSFVPKVDFGILAKKYMLGPIENQEAQIVHSTTDDAYQTTQQIQDEGYNAEHQNNTHQTNFGQLRMANSQIQEPQIQSSERKSEINNLSVQEMDIIMDFVQSEKKVQTPNTLLQKQFYGEGRPQIHLGIIQNEDINNQYLKACEIIYQIEVERMKVVYKEHPKFSEIIDQYSQGMTEFFALEIKLKQESVVKQTLHLQQKQVEICKINAQTAEFERLAALTEDYIRQIDFSLKNLEDLPIINMLRERLNDIFYNKYSKELLSTLIKNKKKSVTQVTSQMLKSLAIKKEEQIEQNATLFHKINRQNQLLQKQIGDIEGQFGSYFHDSQDFDINMIFNNFN